MAIIKILTFYIDIWDYDILNTEKYFETHYKCEIHGTIIGNPTFEYCPKCGTKLIIENREYTRKVRFNDFRLSYKSKMVIDHRNIHILFYEYDDELNTIFTKRIINDNCQGAYNISPIEIEKGIKAFTKKYYEQINQIERYFGCPAIVKFGIINIEE